jgi:hypothetical protein
MIFRKLLISFTIFVIGSALSGCGVASSAVENVTGLIGLNETGTVITNKAQVRSSYAVVAADLLEVKRGDKLDVLDETDFEKVHWYRVRAHDEDATEGWIEAQNVITSELLEKSKKLAEEDKDVQAQAIGQLRAATNLRLSPEQNDNNILFKLENSANNEIFEITNWKFVPKSIDASDVDDASKGEAKPIRGKTKNAEIEAAKEADEPEKIDEKYDVWYKVRLDPSVSPAPSGWLLGRQVELQLPSDITFYQDNAKKFVAWYRLDAVDPNENLSIKGNDAAKISKPGSWVVLTRSNQVKAIDGIEPHFDGVIVFGYDKYKQEHYSSYRVRDIWGVLPLKVEGTGGNKTFILRLRSDDGQMEDRRFVTFRDKERIKVNPPEDMERFEKD